jgi:outer membrane protein OmpA-like peptidoglycan-associated protein
MTKYLVLLICFLLTYQLSGRNLVPNADFSEINYEINIDTSKIYPLFWEHTRGYTNISHIHKNNAGEYSVGVRLSCRFIPHTKNYRDYLFVELNEVLVKDKCYTLKVRAKAWGGYATNALSACLVKKRPEATGYQLLTCENPLDFSYMGLLNSIFGRLIGEDGWEEVETTFKAQGGESYLLIGNFRKDGRFKLRKLKEQKGDEFQVTRWQMDSSTATGRRNITGHYNRYLSYYLIDHVELYESGKPPAEVEPKERTKDKITKKDDSLFLSHTIQINFATASYQIDKSYDSLLDSIAKDIELHSHRLSYLSIIGHTDSTGEAEENLRLSYKRAEAVKTQLVKRGIAAELIRVEGKGDTKQIGDNATEKGRAMNRRIELYYQFRSGY